MTCTAIIFICVDIPSQATATVLTPVHERVWRRVMNEAQGCHFRFYTVHRRVFPLLSIEEINVLSFLVKNPTKLHTVRNETKEVARDKGTSKRRKMKPFYLKELDKIGTRRSPLVGALPLLSKLKGLEQILCSAYKECDFEAGAELSLSDWSLLFSKSGQKLQTPHTDYDREAVTAAVGQYPGRHSFAVLIAIANGANIGFWKSPDNLNEFDVEILNAGDVVVFRDDAVHAGGQYLHEGHFCRIHAYMDSKYVPVRIGNDWMHI